MARRVAKLTDQALVAVLDEALRTGALALPDACKAIRARLGLSQAAFAGRAGVALKVVKELENGKGNPRLESLRRIAAATGLALEIGFVPRSGANVSFAPARRLKRREARLRRAGLRALLHGKASLEARHAQTALRGSDFEIELAPIA